MWQIKFIIQGFLQMFSEFMNWTLPSSSLIIVLGSYCYCNKVCKFSGLKCTHLFSYISGGCKFKMGSPGQNSSRTPLGGEIYFLCFPHIKAFLCFLVCSALLHLQSEQWGISKFVSGSPFPLLSLHHILSNTDCPAVLLMTTFVVASGPPPISLK